MKRCHWSNGVGWGRDPEDERVSLEELGVKEWDCGRGTEDGKVLLEEFEVVDWARAGAMRMKRCRCKSLGWCSDGVGWSRDTEDEQVSL